MVFCRECKKKVVDCPHFVYPIDAPRVRVFDEKVETLAYSKGERVLEIEFKTGQVWQLSPVPEAVYQEIRDTTIWSFLKFLARRYKAVPVKTGLKAIRVPQEETCMTCQKPMTVRHRINSQFDINVRVLWECLSCGNTEWKQYGGGLKREPKGRWH